jgi:hypothetical protein
VLKGFGWRGVPSDRCGWWFRRAITQPSTSRIDDHCPAALI